MEENLETLLDFVIEESKRDEDFKNKLLDALSEEGFKRKYSKKDKMPIINPLEIIRAGEDELREALDGLNLVELKNIIRFYEMDFANVTNRWRNKERLISYILEYSINNEWKYRKKR